MEQNKTTIWTPEFISIFCINVILQMGMYMMNSLVSKFADSLGATPAMIGWVSSMFGITSLAMSPVTGPAFDSFSKKRLLSIATFMTAIVFLIYSSAQSVMVILIARILHGISSGCVVPLCLLLASDALPEEKMASGIGTFSLAQCTASAIAPGIGLALADKIGFNRTFLVGAVCMLVSFGLTFFIKEKEKERKPFCIRLDSVLSKRSLIAGGVMFFACFALTCINSFIIVYADALQIDNIALYFTVYAVGLMFVQPVFGRIADRYGLTVVVVFGTVTYAVSVLVIGSANALWMFLAAAVLAALGYGAIHPTMQSLSIRCAEDGKRGAASNTYYMCVNLSLFIGPVVAGNIADIYVAAGHSLAASYAAMYRFMVVPIVLGLLTYLLLQNKLPQSIKR